MTRLQELKRQVMNLTDGERAALASDLLHTLPAVLSDDDEGVAEALRREADLVEDRATGIEWKDLKRELGR